MILLYLNMKIYSYLILCNACERLIPLLWSLCNYFTIDFN